MNDETRVHPALSAKEWAGGLAGPFQLDPETREISEYTGGPDGSFRVDAKDRHEMAALLLHGQPFGFTWAMHDAIRDMLAEHEGDSFHPLPDDERALVRAALANMAALLSPRSPNP